MCEIAKEEGIPENEIGYLSCLNLPDSENNIITENKLGRVNMQGKAKTVIVEIRPREGWEKPHVHVYNNDNNKKSFKTAIRLDKADYFIHKQYNSIFTDDQARIFDEFMREKIDTNGETRWTKAVKFFNQYYPNHKIDINSQPDYTKINYTEKE